MDSKIDPQLAFCIIGKLYYEVESLNFSLERNKKQAEEVLRNLERQLVEEQRKTAEYESRRHPTVPHNNGTDKI